MPMVIEYFIIWTHINLSKIINYFSLKIMVQLVIAMHIWIFLTLLNNDIFMDKAIFLGHIF